MQQKSQRLSHYASQLGLQLNTNKTEEMRLNVTCQDKLIVNGKEIKQVEKIVYLGTTMSTEDSTQKDIKNRLSKARAAFHKLRPIWKTNHTAGKLKSSYTTAMLNQYCCMEVNVGELPEQT